MVIYLLFFQYKISLVISQGKWNLDGDFEGISGNFLLKENFSVHIFVVISHYSFIAEQNSVYLQPQPSNLKMQNQILAKRLPVQEIEIPDERMKFRKLFKTCFSIRDTLCTNILEKKLPHSRTKSEKKGCKIQNFNIPFFFFNIILY